MEQSEMVWCPKNWACRAHRSWLQTDEQHGVCFWSVPGKFGALIVRDGIELRVLWMPWEK